MSYIDKTANNEIQSYLKETFQIKMLNRKEIKKFEIEDINLEMALAIENYETITQNNLSFLNE